MPFQLQIHMWAELDDASRATLLQRPALRSEADIRAQVAAIIATVRRDGDKALSDYSQQFDAATPAALRVSSADVDAAVRGVGSDALAAIDLAIANVRRFHEAQRPKNLAVETMPGVLCERICQPIENVGLYVPAGTAALPSAAVMLAVPAGIAGCARRVLCTPPGQDGRANAAVIAAASRAGVTEIYAVGGAQAIAAMAYGTQTIPKVDKIFGPGNAWVTCAKTEVSMDSLGAAIDMPAGPSELLVIADDAARPQFVAADLLSQAEHGIDSQVLLITTSAKFAKHVSEELSRQLTALSRAGIAAQALAHSRIVVVDTIETAVQISNRYAPEHLILQLANAREVLKSVQNAGSVFVGPWAPESVGDYCSGTNHVLPTYGHARSYSGLGVDQFMRYMTVQELTRDGLAGLADAVKTLAGLEGLDAHAAAVQCRLDCAR